MTDDLSRLSSFIRVIPDYPSAGIQFQDITPLLADAWALRRAAELMVEPFAGQFDVVAGIEARGFIFAGVAAALAGTGFVPLRKAGKLPVPAARVDYDLEYGSAAIEASDQLAPGVRVLLIDDILATGGTLAAGLELISTLGAQTIGTSVLLELEDLDGRERVPNVHSLFAV
ncbi:MAG TPA: adenine phosphoribosyltransferase [Brevibacterium ravenspurgense]|nr:adenine phosphoribosyltransferase [Brevibacterium ravenspurgense]